MDCQDLHDHYDFNYNIEDRAVALWNGIISGSYIVSQSFLYRSEKKFGVCRHMDITSPADALTLQILVDTEADDILKNNHRPTHFTRVRNIIYQHRTKPQNMDWAFEVSGKRLQKEIYRFRRDKELLAVTDLTNYYNTIKIEELRKVF